MARSGAAFSPFEVVCMGRKYLGELELSDEATALSLRKNRLFLTFV
jgi:hypothetical protein